MNYIELLSIEDQPFVTASHQLAPWCHPMPVPSKLLQTRWTNRSASHSDFRGPTGLDGGAGGGGYPNGWFHGKSPSKMDENRENPLFHIIFMDIL